MEAFVGIYAALIEARRKTLADVPKPLRKAVEEALEQRSETVREGAPTMGLGELAE